jgi:hypothetical protein
MSYKRCMVSQGDIKELMVVDKSRGAGILWLKKTMYGSTGLHKRTYGS